MGRVAFVHLGEKSRLSLLIQTIDSTVHVGDERQFTRKDSGALSRTRSLPWNSTASRRCCQH